MASQRPADRKISRLLRVGDHSDLKLSVFNEDLISAVWHTSQAGETLVEGPLVSASKLTIMKMSQHTIDQGIDSGLFADQAQLVGHAQALRETKLALPRQR